MMMELISKNSIKRILIILSLFIILFTITSCEMQEAPNPETAKESGSRFVMINWSTVNNKPDVFVYVDTETGVAYSITHNGSLMPLYDAEGNILVYEEYIK